MLFDRETIYGIVKARSYNKRQAALMQDAPLTDEQLRWWDEADILYKAEREAARLEKAKAAQAAARERRAAEQAAAERNLAAQLTGTAWPAAEGSGPMSDLERQRKHRAAGRDIGEIPPPRHRRIRERCRYDLPLFGRLFCTGAHKMLHRAPSPRMLEFVLTLQDTILNGGNRHVRWPRGKGKTTWLKVAAEWCLCYGHRSFILFISASRNLSEAAAKEIWETLSEDPMIAADFPEIAIPLADVALTPQRTRHQTYHGRRTGIEDTSARGGHRRLAQLDGYPNTGGILAARGADQRIRGLNIKSRRPDFIFIDDPQTGAETEGVLNKIEANIQNVILNLGSSDVRTAAVMASTPVRLNDISERFADPERNPAWRTTTERLVVSWGPEEWKERYFAEKRIGDERGRAFYAEHREDIERGAEMFDPGDGDRRTQVSAYQFALDKLFEIGEMAFFAEYQMRPPASAFAFVLTQRLVLSRIRRGVPPNMPVPNAVLTVAATDINPGYALSTSVYSFDLSLCGLVMAYRAAPVRIPDALNDVEFEARVFEALAEHGREIASLGIKLDLWGVDAGGRQFKAVTRFAPQSAQLCALAATPMLGRAGKNWNPNVKSRIRAALNDTVRCRDAQHREWVAFNADVYKERYQKAWGAEIGAPGSLSLFDGGADHSQFALQVSNEKLKGKQALGDDRWKYIWESNDPHDFLDTGAMALALAGSVGLTGDGTYQADDGGGDEVVFL